MVFHLSVFRCRRIRGLCKLPDGRDCLRSCSHERGHAQFSQSVVSNSWIPWTVAHQTLLCMDLPRQDTGVGSVQYSSVAQSCLALCNPMNLSMPGLPVHHQPPESTQTHVHGVGDAIQPSHPLLSPSPPAPNPSQHQGHFKLVSSSHQVAKVLEFQLQHQLFQ